MPSANKSSSNWEVSIMEFKIDSKKIYKVTRKIPKLRGTETKFFALKELAKRQFDDWLK